MINKILNLGCGESTMTGMINVDIRHLPGVDIVADVRNLPFKDCEIEGMVSRNLIEHFGRYEIEELLQEWARVLMIGGYVKIETVDGGETMSNWKNIPEDNLLDAILGAQTYPENFHKMIFTKETLIRYLEKANFEIKEVNQFIAREIPRIIIIGIKK